VLIEIVKRGDQSGVLRCTRDDGSVAWQKQERHGAHFALHDITHYVVETTLGLSDAFFGLISQGWEIVDTTGKGSRGPVPSEAAMAESIVGLFDSERASETTWTTQEIDQSLPAGIPRPSAEALAIIRQRRSEIFQQWAAVPVGQALKLRF
jgi:hypothetical protein